MLTVDKSGMSGPNRNTKLLETIRARIQERLDATGETPRNVSLRAGLSPGAVSDIFRKANFPRVDTIDAIAKSLDTNIAYLIGSSNGLVRTGITDDGEVRSLAVATSEGVVGVSAGEIPQVDAYLGAGMAAEADQHIVEIAAGETIVGAPIIDTWKIPDSILSRRVRGSRKSLHFVECLGDSMEPTISDGDVALIDTGHRIPSPSGIYALWDGFGQVIKRLEIVPNTDPVTVRIISDNEHHGAYERTLDEVSIIGRYVGRFTTN